MQVASAIASRIDELIVDAEVSAATLLLPSVTALENLTAVALALRPYQGWAVTTSAIQNSRAGDLVAVHIVRHIPFGCVTCPSEALVLGPFDDFPPTRRAPVTALEIFVGEPMPLDPKEHTPTTKANLAHMDLSTGADLEGAQIDTMWKMSMAARLKSLGGEDSRAKAKVSFVIPTSLALQLGCAP